MTPLKRALYCKAMTSPQLDNALNQIADIRQQIARTQTFRGYRSLTTAISGLIGITAALVQWACDVDPTRHLGAYLLIWFCAAAASIAIVGTEIFFRCRRGAIRFSASLVFMRSSNSFQASSPVLY